MGSLNSVILGYFFICCNFWPCMIWPNFPHQALSLQQVWFALALRIVFLMVWLFLRCFFPHEVAPVSPPGCLKLAFLIKKTNLRILPFFHSLSFSFYSVSWSLPFGFLSQHDITHYRYDVKTAYQVDLKQTHLASLVFQSYIITYSLEMCKQNPLHCCHNPLSAWRNSIANYV